jgi:hypothetical protein
MYLTTHIYFLLKRLELFERQHQCHNHSLLDLRRSVAGGVVANIPNLADGLPDNSIIQQSFSLFDDDVRLDLL